MFFPNVVKKNSALAIVPNIGERGISYWFMLDLKKAWNKYSFGNLGKNRNSKFQVMPAKTETENKSASTRQFFE